MAEQEFYSGKILYPVVLALLVLSLLFGFAILPRLFGSPEAQLVGKPAPNFTLKVLANSDKPTLALRELQGSAVLLDFWATWCGPCQLEAPVVNKIAQRFQDQGLVVVGVDTNDANGEKAAPAWAAKHGLTYPIVFDADDTAANAYDVDSMPTLVVVTRAGTVLAVLHGMHDEDELASLVKQAL